MGYCNPFGPWNILLTYDTTSPHPTPPQFAAGWDWAQGIPDRVSGLFSPLTLSSSHSYFRVTSASLRTRDVTRGTVDVLYVLAAREGAGEGEGKAGLKVEFEGKVLFVGTLTAAMAALLVALYGTKCPTHITLSLARCPH